MLNNNKPSGQAEELDYNLCWIKLLFHYQHTAPPPPPLLIWWNLIAWRKHPSSPSVFLLHDHFLCNLTDSSIWEGKKSKTPASANKEMTNGVKLHDLSAPRLKISFVWLWDVLLEYGFWQCFFQHSIINCLVIFIRLKWLLLSSIRRTQSHDRLIVLKGTFSFKSF